jgi:preprotein translocase subunit SecG
LELLEPVFCLYNPLFHCGNPTIPPDREDTVVAIIGVTTWAHLLNIVIIFLTFLLIVIVLIQRGRGGGLAGAFGGAGGSSAFGSRAGDALTRITIGLAAFWVLFIMIQVKVIKSYNSKPDGSSYVQNQ